MAESANPNRARDHLANERKFLAWVQTEPRLWCSVRDQGFSIVLRQLTALQGHPGHRVILVLAAWYGTGRRGHGWWHAHLSRRGLC